MALAEGRTEPADWLAWWDAHSEAVEKLVNRGTFLRVKPPRQGRSANFSAMSSQKGIGIFLNEAGIPYVLSDRYQQADAEEFEAYRTSKRAAEKRRLKEWMPIIEALKPTFPKFAAFLKRRAVEIDELAAPKTWNAQEAMPSRYTEFCRCVGGLKIAGLDFNDPFDHPGTGDGRQWLCIADYFLEADGDQILIAKEDMSLDDPPVHYFAHAVPLLKATGMTFTAWIECLPRSPMFQ